MWSDVGNRCHWCGVDCVGKPQPKTGEHRFCCDACRIAHHRAFKTWTANRVTHGARSGRAQGSSILAKRNTKGGRPGGGYAGEIPYCGKNKRNTKRGKKRAVTS